MHTTFLLVKPEGRKELEESGVDKMKILKQILK